MNENLFTELSAWMTHAGLAGTPETDIVSVFCDRCVAAGIPLDRAHVFIDTLHPVYEGRMFRWGYSPNESAVHEYGRTSSEGPAVSGPVSLDEQATDMWRRGPFYNMLQTGASLMRRRLKTDTIDEFSLLPEWLAAGMTDYVAIITRFAPEGVIGEMDAVYSSWGTRAPEGFNDGQIATLKHIVPSLALAIKSVSLARMTRTLMETYLGRDAGQRVLSGRIVRGIAERIDAVVWFSDLRGFTRITDTAPEQVIPLLNDYSDVIVSAIHEYGGDVLKLIGDGTLAIFTAENRMYACNAALSAAIAARRGVAELKKRRTAEDKPITDMYLGLHVGKVFYGKTADKPNFGTAGENWEKEGWLVPVEFTEVGANVRPKDFIEELRPHLAQKYAPLQSNGNGIQSVSDSFADVLLRKIGKPASTFTDAVVIEEEKTDDQVQKGIEGRTDIGPTQKQQLVQARRGQ
jgi:adenylate cyclase